jgi:hypothetical protein
MKQNDALLKDTMGRDALIQRPFFRDGEVTASPGVGNGMVTVTPRAWSRVKKGQSAVI